MGENPSYRDRIPLRTSSGHAGASSSFLLWVHPTFVPAMCTDTAVQVNLQRGSQGIRYFMIIPIFSIVNNKNIVKQHINYITVMKFAK